MKRFVWTLLSGLFLCAGWDVADCQKAAAEASGDKSIEKAIRMDEIKWVDAPAKFVKGAKTAVLLGDPAKPGMFIIRFKLPANYKIAPHTHPQQEHVTVLQGGLAIGMGTKMDLTTPVMPVGSFMLTPANKPHFVFTKQETITEVSGMGPFELHYTHAEDDPSKPANPTAK